jgi:hypothetical protein
MASSVYQNMVNLVVGFRIRRRRSIFMNVGIWELCTFHFEILDVVKLTTVTPL